MSAADRELLELAAKAAGYKFDSTNPFEICVPHKGGDNYIEWDPLVDDGDALRLAVKLIIAVNWTTMHGNKHFAYARECFVEYTKLAEKPAATRRAIVRAAAEIGKAIP